MKTIQNSKLLALMLCVGLMFSSLRAAAQDIDIFVGSSAGASGNPNVLIILDNTTNWADQAQHWPDASTQGYSEVMAIKNVVDTLNDQINVGLMMYPFNAGGADGGFIRQAVVPMSASNKSAFKNKLDVISNEINGTPNEAASASRANGTILFDAYKYFGGYTSPAHATDNVAGTPTDSTHYGPTSFAASSSVPSSYADPAGYASSFTTFSSPISSANSCAKNFIIYIGNGFPSGTDSTTLLSNVGCDATLLARPTVTSTPTTTPTALGTTAQCYSSQTACTSGAPEVAACPSGYDNCACTSTASGSATCPSGQLYYTVTKTSTTTTHDTTSLICVSNTSSYHCPTGASCSFTQTAAVCSPSTKHSYDISITTTTTSTGLSSQCYASTSACSAAEGGTCATPSQSTNSCATGSSRYNYVGNIITNTTTMTGTASVPTGNAAKSLADVWGKCLYQTDVSSAPGQQNVATYAIDVYYAKPDANQNSLLYNMAKYGGGKYFPATSAAAITNALKQIFGEIQSVNSTFASASLPVNATNRAQNENQVFIGMFRPDPDAYPRWFGNMKRYQLIQSGGDIVLGDFNGSLAINTQTGFFTDCATSWWTTNSGSYWQTVPVSPSPAGTCLNTLYDKFSDSPDGPRVEKGAVAEVLRMGNNPPYTDMPAVRVVNRTVYTLSGSSLTAFNMASSGLSASDVDFTLGKDINLERTNGTTTEPRPSIHGDVIHSRPLPVNYGGTTGVTVYYGANDGTLRAVNAANGQERWAFIAPESFSKLSRLASNSPLVSYPNVSTTITPTPIPKDFFFDGSVGIYQNGDNSKVWIYPTMRRGGRMIYAFDVTNPTSPAYKWKAGCPNLTNDTSCVDGVGGATTSAFGQTWSVPNVAFVKGYSTTTPVILVGGGYDACEDADSSSPSCTSPKGAGVHVINADTGAIIKSFNTTRSVAADVSLIDVDNDGSVDYAYVADTGGNIWRINLTDANSNNWSITRVAYTNGAGRKFLFGPALLSATGGKVYLAIGSGDREHPLQSNYPYTTPVTNRFYVYLDDLASTAATNLDDATGMSNFTSSTDCSTSPVLTTSSQKGWFMDLPGLGEQTVTSAVIAGGMVTFSTNRPIPAATGTCSTALGEARGYWVNLFNASGAISAPGNASCGGVRSAAFVGGGLPPSPVLGTVPIGGRPTTVVIGAVQRSGGASSPVSPQQVKPTISGKRKIIYWKSSGDN